MSFTNRTHQNKLYRNIRHRFSIPFIFVFLTTNLPVLELTIYSTIEQIGYLLANNKTMFISKQLHICFSKHN